MKNKSNLFTNINDDYFLKSKYSWYETAKKINPKGLGRNTLTAFLRWKKIIDDENLPCRNLDSREYFIIDRVYKKVGIFNVTKVTPSGLNFIQELINKYYQEYLEFKNSSKS
jgi:phage antirepressor YoqD-like protein